MQRRLPLLVALLLAPACSGEGADSQPTADGLYAWYDEDAASGAVDVANPEDAPIAAADTWTTPDALPPVELPGAPDATPDAAADPAEPDAPPDTAPDATPDVAPDVALVEDVAGPTSCWDPAPADADRAVIYARPYGQIGTKPKLWSVGALAADGSLTVDLTTFEMGRGPWGVLSFTPNGRFGFVAQEDGSIGVIEVTPDHGVVVRQPGWTGATYADVAVADPAGGRLYLVNPNWPGSGGGVYAVDVDCDGALTPVGLALPTRNARGLHVLGPDRALVFGRNPEPGGPPQHAHLADTSTWPWTVLASADAFGDDEAILASSAVTADGAVALVGDNSAFSGIPNRVALLALGDDSVTPEYVLSPMKDPFAMAASPFGPQVLLASGEGNALHRVVVGGAGTTVAQTLSSPLAGDIVIVTRGALTGMAIVAQNDGLRRVRFEPEGPFTDLGLTSIGEGYPGIPGALGVQP